MGNAIQRVTDGFYRLLEVVLVICMLVMFGLVFVNVIMRLFFNSGIDVSEELPRFAFIWMTFIGAVIGMRRHAHLGVDMIVRLLPVFGRKVCWGISQTIMAICSLYMLYGTWVQHDILKANVSAVMQMSMLYVYGVSYLTGVVITFLCASNLLRLFLGQVEEHELIDVEEEGMAEVHEIEAEMAAHAHPQNKSKEGGRA